MSASGLNNAQNRDTSGLVNRKPIKKPTTSSRVNEEDEFSYSRFFKAFFLTMVCLVVFALVLTHISHVVVNTYHGGIKAFAVGIAGLSLNIGISTKIITYLNKALFIKEDEDDLKKYS